ncbi:MAG: ribonuclease D [Gammaproteobacteria bacterium]|jgi:ribonuclease D|nr:ribonuclease D [Gammaproteobacteria bacterium]
MVVAATPYIYVDSDADLLSACEYLHRGTQVALDTEFMRVDTFYPQVGLVQLSDAERTYLIDPLTIHDWQPLQSLLVSPRVSKVLHACAEDLEVFRHWLGIVPTPIIDTQIAAAYVGHGLSMGLQNLVRTLLGVELEKGETRSNWLQRPLTASQRHYAALDVSLLLQCFAELQKTLKAQNKWLWFMADMQVLALAKPAVEPQHSYQNINNAWRLQGLELVRLQVLAKWRETQARDLDKPRSFILKDASLIDIAQNNPKHMQALATVQDMRPSSLRRYGKAVLEQLALANEGFAQDTISMPVALPLPLNKAEQKNYKKLQACINNLAKEHDLLPQILARKKELLALFERHRQAQAFMLPSTWQGWRAELLRQPIHDLFNQL